MKSCGSCKYYEAYERNGKHVAIGECQNSATTFSTVFDDAVHPECWEGKE